MPALTLNDQLLLWLAGDLTQATAQNLSGLQSRPSLSTIENYALTDRVLLRSGSSRILTYNISNPNSAVAYVQLFNTGNVAGVTLGTTNPTKQLAIPAGGVLDGTWDFGPQFNAGLVAAATTGPKGTTVVTTGVVVSFGVL